MPPHMRREVKSLTVLELFTFSSVREWKCSKLHSLLKKFRSDLNADRHQADQYKET
jgi:hypothetical protein